MNDHSTTKKEYLGDGVYASVRFGDLMLETDRDGLTHWIVLEPQVYAALVEYVERRFKSSNADGR